MKYLAVIALSIALVGCTPEAEPVDPKPTETVEVAPSPEVNMDQVYLDQLRNDNVALEGVPDAQLIDLGHEICGAFDRGASFNEVAQVTIDNGFAPENGGWMIGTAIGAYCPEHEGVIP